MVYADGLLPIVLRSTSSEQSRKITLILRNWHKVAWKALGSLDWGWL